jgi:hypothetical protein
MRNEEEDEHEHEEEDEENGALYTCCADAAVHQMNSALARLDE